MDIFLWQSFSVLVVGVFGAATVVWAYYVLKLYLGVETVFWV